MRLRAALGLIALIAVVLPAGPAAPPACATEAPHAALVVSTGQKVLKYCVMLDQPSVSGLRLIELAHDQYGLAYRSDGAAVCMLAGTGTTDGDCFGDYPDYWGYWRGNGSGGWTWAGSGAATTSVRNGQVEGWAWGSGDDGTSHPRPPATTFSSVCASTRPTPSSAPTHQPSSRAVPSPTGPAANPSPSGTRPRHHKAPVSTGGAARKHRLAIRPRSRTQHGGARPTPRQSAVAAGATDPGAGSIPGGGVAALLVAAGLGAVGWLLVRRRHLDA